MLAQTMMTFPALAFERMIYRLGSGRGINFLGLQAPGPVISVCWMGLYRREGRLELLHRRTEYAGAGTQLDEEVRQCCQAGLSPVIVAYGSSRPNANQMQRYVSALGQAVDMCCGFVQVARAREILTASGFVAEENRFLPVDMINLPGPGMLRLAVGRVWPVDTAAEAGPAGAGTDTRGAGGTGKERDLSRRIAFLGRGDMPRGLELFSRIKGLRITLIGAGRAGSKLLIELVKAGFAWEGGCYVADGDLVEEANLDVMLLPRSSVGKPKAEEVARLAMAVEQSCRVYPIVGTISDGLAAEAAASSDIIITCADNDAAVFGSEVLARRYNRVHLAVTGGTARTVSNAVAAGGEVRLSLCGCPGCCICFGSLDVRRCMRELSRSPEQERADRLNADPLRERAGSDGGILSSVVGGAMHLLDRLVQGTQRRSVWMHYDVNGEIPGWSDWTSRARRSCKYCAAEQFGGDGDWEEHDG